MCWFPFLALMFSTTSVSCSSSLEGFTCGFHVQCQSGSSDGECEANGRCSYSDGSCHSGRRYGPESGGDSERCTQIEADANTAAADANMARDAEDMDAGATDAGATDAGATDADIGTDAAGSGATARVLDVVVAGVGILNIRAGGELLGLCVGSSGAEGTTCTYDVEFDGSIMIESSAATNSADVSGTCPTSCQSTPCNFAMEEDCGFIANFQF